MQRVVTRFAEPESRVHRKFPERLTGAVAVPS